MDREREFSRHASGGSRAARATWRVVWRDFLSAPTKCDSTSDCGHGSLQRAPSLEIDAISVGKQRRRPRPQTLEVEWEECFLGFLRRRS